MKTIEVQCRCGSIALKISGDPAAHLYCHCDDCRTAQGAAYVSAAIYPAQAVQVIRGNPTPIVVKTTPRMRCETCGTFLFAELSSFGMSSVNGSLLPKGEFNPQFHIQCQHAVLPVVDKLPHYKGLPASFGGAEEFVTW